MSRHLLFASVICISVSACGRTSGISDRPDAVAQQTPMTAAGATVGDFIIAAPVSHGNVTVYPVLSRSPRTEDRVITLNEGLKAGTVEILEMGARPGNIRQEEDASQRSDAAAQPDGNPEQSGDGNSEEFDEGDNVNRLLVFNRSAKPLYLMPGEVIIGGSQDRAIAEETVVLATGKPVPVAVYCVEPGRWGMRDYAESDGILDTAEQPADSAALAIAANAGKFVAQTGNLNKSSRLAVHDGAGQQKVWEEVAKANDASGVTWSSGAFTANYADKGVLERMQPYLDALSGPVSRQEHIVGIVVAINGKIDTVDVFEATPLFLKLWPHILKSIALDALDVADAEVTEPASTPAVAAEFVESVIRDRGDEAGKVDGGLVVSRHETKDTVSFSAMGGMGMGGFGGGFGAPIHSSGFSK